MLIQELTEHLRWLARIYSVGGATGPARDLEALAAALEPDAAKTVAEYVACTLLSLDRTKQPPKRGAKGDPVLVQWYVEKLGQASGDEAQLETLLEQIKGDTRLSKQSLTDLVNSFSGHEGSFRSKSAALEWLKSAFIEQLRFRNKLSASN